MYGLYFNIRVGVRHFQLTKKWEFYLGVVNEHYVRNPPTKFIEIYTFFGKDYLTDLDD